MRSRRTFALSAILRHNNAPPAPRRGGGRNRPITLLPAGSTKYPYLRTLCSPGKPRSDVRNERGACSRHEHEEKPPYCYWGEGGMISCLLLQPCGNEAQWIRRHNQAPCSHDTGTIVTKIVKASAACGIWSPDLSEGARTPQHRGHTHTHKHGHPPHPLCDRRAGIYYSTSKPDTDS